MRASPTASPSRSKLPFRRCSVSSRWQLGVVDAHVVVDQPPRAAFVRQRVVQIEEHHVGVVHRVLCVFGEAVAVVPLAHQAERLVHVLVEHAALAVHLEHPSHFRFGEAEQLVELRQQTDVGADVEAAGDVVHRHGRDAGDEQAVHAVGLRAGLQGGEEAAVEATAVCEGVVGVRAALGKDGVGEVVVFVDQNVEQDAVVPAVLEQCHELVVDGGLPAQALGDVSRKDGRISCQRTRKRDAAVALEVALQRFEGVVEGGEVEPQHHVAAAIGRGLPADVRAVEHGLEGIGLVAPVVAL